MRPLFLISLVLVVIGAINWGLIGLFRFDLVAAIFGEMSAISRFVYTLVGIAGVLLAVTAAPLLNNRTAPALNPR